MNQNLIRLVIFESILIKIWFKYYWNYSNQNILIQIVLIVFKSKTFEYQKLLIAFAWLCESFQKQCKIITCKPIQIKRDRKLINAFLLCKNNFVTKILCSEQLFDQLWNILKRKKWPTNFFIIKILTTFLTNHILYLF